MTKEEAFEEGFRAACISGDWPDNPYWPEYPNRSKRGEQDETNARFFVDGVVAGIRAVNG